MTWVGLQCVIVIFMFTFLLILGKSSGYLAPPNIDLDFAIVKTKNMLRSRGGFEFVFVTLFCLFFAKFSYRLFFCGSFFEICVSYLSLPY